MDSQIELSIRKSALQNAVKFSGKANQNSVLGAVLKEHPELKNDIKSLTEQIAYVIEELSRIPVAEQFEELKKLSPDALEKKEKEERNIFASLRITPGAIVKTAFPPGPEKYPHIGHAKSLLLNCMLAKQYNGKFILRFEDTNPKLVKKEFYEIMIENFKWLGADWDELQYASDYMDIFYRYAEQLISDGEAYVCFCPSEKQRELRNSKKECDHRLLSSSQNLHFWKKMPSYKEGEASLRLKMDLAHENNVFRDPTIFRILDTEHARHGTKYRLWPNYDFQNAVMDGYFGITNRIRGKEFELRAPLQRYIQKLLGFPITQTTEYGRFNLEGVPSAGRIIRQKLEAGELMGWDDPSLTTVVALRRRGFTAKAIRDFVLSTGLSKADASITWDDFIIHNRRVLDREAKRFFFIKDPVEIRVEGAPRQEVRLNYHPDQKTGERKLLTDDRFYLAKEDAGSFSDGQMVRLMECVNFRKQDGKFTYVSNDYIDYKNFDGRKSIIHWLPKDSSLIDVEILMPDKSVVRGFGEPNIAVLEEGDIIQFERFGFCRLDRKENSKFFFWYTHD